MSHADDLSKKVEGFAKSLNDKMDQYRRGGSPSAPPPVDSNVPLGQSVGVYADDYISSKSKEWGWEQTWAKELEAEGIPTIITNWLRYWGGR